MIPLLVVIGCPSPSPILGALQLFGFVAVVVVAGVLLAWFWESWQARVRKHYAEEEG